MSMESTAVLARSRLRFAIIHPFPFSLLILLLVGVKGEASLVADILQKLLER